MDKEPHAITRARERYGLDLTVDDLAEISRLCLSGAGIKVDAFKPGWGTIYALRFKGENIVPLISAEGTVISIFPPNAMRNRIRRFHKEIQPETRKKGGRRRARLRWDRKRRPLITVEIDDN